MTQEMCHRVVYRCFFVFDSIPDHYKTQIMFVRAVSDDPSWIANCPNKYITQEMCDEALDDSLAVLKLIPDWFVTSKMIKELFTVFYADKNKLYFNEYSGDVVFNWNETGILDIDLNNISRDNNFDEDDTDIIVLVRVLAWHFIFEKRKALKKI